MKKRRTRKTQTPSFASLSRREREIMEILYRTDEATVAEVTEAMPDELSRNGVRTLINVLENKGHLSRRKRGREFLYRPVVSAEAAAKGVLDNVLDLFFNGSIAKALTVRLEGDGDLPGEQEIEELEALIQAARDRNEAAASNDDRA